MRTRERIFFYVASSFRSRTATAAGTESILRRAHKRQEHFASNKVESVANTTAFVSPAAFNLDSLNHAAGADQSLGANRFKRA